jgi:acetolactate synthase regulatory subunit
MNLVMSRHALEQARERGISINEIKETITNGAKFFQDEKIIAKHRHIQIVFKKINEYYFVITVMIRK